MARAFNWGMAWRFAEITKGMTQEQIAERLDCSVGQVNMMLSGKRKFHTLWISRISKAFGIPEWQLFAAPAEVLPPEYTAWQAAYAALDDNDKRIVDNTMLAGSIRSATADKKKNST